MIIDKLIEKIEKTSNPTVVGLDPRLDLIPDYIVERNFKKHGQTLKGASESFYDFNVAIIDKIFDLVPAIKPQIAMYEQFGLEGIMTYIKTIQYAKSKGLIIIGDVKRSDIASTAQAYADGHIGRVKVGDENYVVYHEDFITLNPYLGFDSIEPYVNNCKSYEKGLFILVKTSNPNSGEIQDLELKNGQKVYEKVGELVSNWGKPLIGEYGFSEIGAVVGATHPEQATKLRKLMPNTFFLVPGYGAQGATADDLKGCFNDKGIGAIVNSSRGIISAYRNEKYENHFEERDFANASRQAVIDMKNDLAVYIK